LSPARTGHALAWRALGEPVVLDQGEADRYAQWFYDAFDPITHLDAYRRDLAIKFFCGGSDQHVPAEEAKAQYCVGKMYHKG
jgi:hypothetical protein